MGEKNKRKKSKKKRKEPWLKNGACGRRSPAPPAPCSPHSGSLIFFPPVFGIKTQKYVLGNHPFARSREGDALLGWPRLLSAARSPQFAGAAEKSIKSKAKCVLGGGGRDTRTRAAPPKAASSDPGTGRDRGAGRGGGVFHRDRGSLPGQRRRLHRGAASCTRCRGLGAGSRSPVRPYFDGRARPSLRGGPGRDVPKGASSAQKQTGELWKL